MKQEIINKIRDYFKNKPINKVYLFGSFARDDFDSKSDIDILIDLDYSQKVGIEFFAWHLDLEELLGRKVDLVTTKSISDLIEPYVNSDRELVYEKENIKQDQTITY